jgi:mannose-6-phosphate isomerase-like protein (cupin superfamily)
VARYGAVVSDVRRGRLAPANAVPATGEIVELLVERETVRIEHILSGHLVEPLSYDQERDEWVTVLEGSAELEIGGETLSLKAGDWVLLPRRRVHRLLRTDPGTRWLAVHFH